MSRFLIPLLIACGGSMPEPEVPAQAILSGGYTLDLSPSARTGTCEFVPDYNEGKVTFDAEGSLESPLEGVVSCITAYADGRVTFTCKGLDNTLTARTRGGFSVDKAGIVTSTWGSGEFTGNVGGCTGLTFDFTLTRNP